MEKNKRTKKINFKMKKTLLIRIVPLVLLAISFQSCFDELDQVNPNALTNESFWTSTNDLNAGLNAVYAALRDENVSGVLFESTRTDLAVPRSQRSNDLGNPIYDQTFDLTTDQVQDKWDACYRGVFRANQVLDAYEILKTSFDSNRAEEEGIRIAAQARALRGYFYYVLHSTYNNGSIPLFETVPKEFSEFQRSFSSSEDVKALYRADLQFGMENLPINYNDWIQEGSAGDLGRVTAGACEALMAKSYMNDNDFANGEIYLKNVIDNYGYNLVDDLEKCFTGIEEFNNESIFEINYSIIANPLGLDEQDLSQPISERLNNANPMQPSTWFTLMFKAEKPDPADPANRVTRNTYDSNGIVNGSIETTRLFSARMGNSISTVEDPDSPMYGVTAAEYGNHPNAGPHAKNNPNFWKKFTSWNVPNGGAGEDESQQFDRRSGVNIPVIRLAEIYLLYAECMIEKGDLSEALKYINRIRKRSHLYLLGDESGGEFAGDTSTYLNDIDLDPSNGEEPVTLTNLMDHLRLVEKPMELVLEAERTIDLRRWGIWKERLEYIASFEYDTYAFRGDQIGEHRHRFRCYIVPAGTPLEDIPVRVQGNPRRNEPLVRDHFLGSQNFNEELHSYFPVPQDEINANFNWNN